MQILQLVGVFDPDQSLGKWQKLRGKGQAHLGRLDPLRGPRNSLGRHSCALHVAHQQIFPGLRGSVQAWTAEDIHDDNRVKTRQPPLSAGYHLSLQILMRLSRKRKEPQQ